MFFLFLLGCGLLILETTLFHQLALWELKIDGLSLLIIYVSLYWDGLRGIPLIFLLGLLADTFAGSTLGMHAFTYVLLFLVVKLVSRNLVIKNTYQHMAIISVAVFFFNLSLLLLDFVLMGEPISWRHIMISCLQSLLTSALSPLFFLFYDYFERVLRLRPIRERATLG